MSQAEQEQEEQVAALAAAVAACRAAGDRPGEALALTRLAAAHYAAGQFAPALAAWEQALPLLQAEDFRPGVAAVLADMTGPLVRLGREAEAIARLEQALALFEAGLAEDAAGQTAAPYRAALEALRTRAAAAPPPPLPDDALQAALLALVNSPDLAAKQEALRAGEALLLGDAAAARLAAQIEQYRAAGNEPVAEALTFHAELLQRCREHGVEAGFAALAAVLAAAQDPLQGALAAFVNAGDWAGSRRVLEAQAALLLSDEAEARLGAEIAGLRGAGNGEVAELLAIHRDILRQCRRRGIPAVFADLAE